MVIALFAGHGLGKKHMTTPRFRIFSRGESSVFPKERRSWHALL